MLAKSILTLGLASLGVAKVLEKVFAPLPWCPEQTLPDKERPLELTVVLHLADPDGFMPTVLEGGRLDQQEITSFRQPSNETATYVSDWLEKNEIDFRREDSDLIKLNTTVGKAQDLLNMTLSAYGFTCHVDSILRTTEYSIPDDLEGHIDFIHPLVNFMAPKRNPMWERSNFWAWRQLEFEYPMMPIPKAQAARKQALRDKFFNRYQKWKKEGRHKLEGVEDEKGEKVKQHPKDEEDFEGGEKEVNKAENENENEDEDENEDENEDEDEEDDYDEDDDEYRQGDETDSKKDKDKQREKHKEKIKKEKKEKKKMEKEKKKKQKKLEKELEKQQKEEHNELYHPDGGRKNGERCQWMVTPGCIRTQYEMPSLTDGVGSLPNARLGVAGTLGTSINWPDLEIFSFKRAKALPIEDQVAKTKMEIFKGDKNHPPPKVGGADTMIEVQYGYALAHPHEVTHYTTSTTKLESNDNEPYLDLLVYLLAKPDDELPHVLVLTHAENEQIVPRAYAERVCRYMGMLTGRGVTIITPSGDGGSVGATTHQHCANFGPNLIMASFPATCPWATSVGGHNTKEPEKLTPAGMSGGGFSDYFPRPFWQDQLVTDYQGRLDKIVENKKPKHTPPTDHYNNIMRAIPDIACIGKRFHPVYKGHVTDWPKQMHPIHHETRKGITTMTGAAMIFAAMVLHENDRRLKLGQETLGWLNRKMYETVPRNSFIDIQKKNTLTCEKVEKHEYWGWVATPGWDATTGLGAPKGMELFEHL